MRLDLGRCVCPRGFSSTGPGGGDGTLGAATLSILPLPACKSLIQKGSGRVLMTHEQPGKPGRSEEHTSELQSLMRISYAVFCLKKKNSHSSYTPNTHTSRSIIHTTTTTSNTNYPTNIYPSSR